MRQSAPSPTPHRASHLAHLGGVWLARMTVLIGCGLALGACSKCDVPDFTHWGSPSPPHSCSDAAPQRPID